MRSGNPQVEESYTVFSNELLEAITKECSDVVAIFFAVARQTYGYGGRKRAYISNQTFCELTDIQNKNIHRAIKIAVDKKYILKIEDKSGISYQINKHYKTWKTSSNLRKKQKSVEENEGKQQFKDKLSSNLRKSEPILKIEDAPINTKSSTTRSRNTRRKEKAVPWPKDFKLTEEMKFYAIQKGIDPEKLDLFFEDFKNWADSKDAIYKDWQAAFRTRVIKAQEYGKQFLIDANRPVRPEDVLDAKR